MTGTDVCPQPGGVSRTVETTTSAGRHTTPPSGVEVLRQNPHSFVAVVPSEGRRTGPGPSQLVDPRPCVNRRRSRVYLVWVLRGAFQLVFVEVWMAPCVIDHL